MKRNIRNGSKPRDDKKRREGPKSLALFEDKTPAVPRKKLLKRIKYPIWTEKKAKLIERYMFLFLQVTFHGTYIDAFTGPQEPDKPETWAAKLVLELRPRWLRHFHLFETDPKNVAMIHAMVAIQEPRQKSERKRDVGIYPIDCNEGIKQLLAKETIKPTEATFCLLDQRTFECQWSTLEALARYKTRKVELFYFLATGWLNRSIVATKDFERLRAWWGRDDWEYLLSLDHSACASFVAERIRDEFSYRYVNAWPICSRADEGRVMYYMIHATDHDDAPGLMGRAYEQVVKTPARMEQLKLLAT
jgi:three-Cys-motif partner protein